MIALSSDGLITLSSLETKGMQLTHGVDLETAVAHFDEFKPFLKHQYSEDPVIVDLRLQLLDWLDAEQLT